MRRVNRSLLVALLAVLIAAAAPLSAFAADIVVSAAASLSNSFSEIGKLYEAKHPSDKIVANFAASDVLLKQIEQGAPADVFASADEQTMDRAAQSSAIDASTRKDFAANTLVLIVGANAKSPAKLADTPVAYVPTLIPARLTPEVVAMPDPLVVAVTAGPPLTEKLIVLPLIAVPLEVLVRVAETLVVPA